MYKLRLSSGVTSVGSSQFGALRMDTALFFSLVSGDTLPGNQWLTFVNAGYELTGEAGKIRVARHTTFESQLWPRWYWEPIERLGVRSEHDFVLQSLDQKL